MSIGPITKEISKDRAEQILRLQRIIKEQSKTHNNMSVLDEIKRQNNTISFENFILELQYCDSFFSVFVKKNDRIISFINFDYAVFNRENINDINAFAKFVMQVYNRKQIK